MKTPKPETYTLTIQFTTGSGYGPPLTKKQLKSIAVAMQEKLLRKDAYTSDNPHLPVGYGQWDGDGGAFYMDSIKVKL